MERLGSRTDGYADRQFSRIQNRRRNGRPITTSEASTPRRYHNAPSRNEPRYYDDRDYDDYDNRGHDYYNERNRDYYNERDQDVYSYSRNDPVDPRLDDRYYEGPRRGWDSRQISSMREDQAFADREDRTERQLRDFQRIATTSRSCRDDDFDLRRDFAPERKSFRAHDDLARGYGYSDDYRDRYQDQSYNSKHDSDVYQRYGRNFDEDDDFDQVYQDKRNDQRPMRRRPLSDAGRRPRSGAVSDSGRSPPQRAVSESSRRLPPRAQSDSGRVKSSRSSDGEQYRSSRRPGEYSDGLSVHSAPAASSNGKSAAKNPRPSSERSRKATLPRVDEGNEDYGSYRSRSMEDLDFENRGRALHTASSERGFYEGSQREASRSRNMNGSIDPGTGEDFGNSRKRASSQRASSQRDGLVAQDRDNGTRGSLEAKIAVAYRKLEDSSRNLAVDEERLAEAQEEVRKHKENHGSRAMERQLMDALRRARDKCKDGAAVREADATELQILEDQAVRENEKVRTPKTRRK